MTADPVRAWVGAVAHALNVTDWPAVPFYGSPEWQQLPNGHPVKAAAVLRAAECWRDYTSPERVAADLREDLASRDREIRRRIRQTSWDVAAAADWRAQAQRPTHAELEQRRKVKAA